MQCQDSRQGSPVFPRERVSPPYSDIKGAPRLRQYFIRTWTQLPHLSARAGATSPRPARNVGREQEVQRAADPLALRNLAPRRTHQTAAPAACTRPFLPHSYSSNLRRTASISEKEKSSDVSSGRALGKVR